MDSSHAMAESARTRQADEGELARREAQDFRLALEESRAMYRGLTFGDGEEDDLARALRESMAMSNGLPAGARRAGGKERELNELDMVLALSREDAAARGEPPPDYAMAMKGQSAAPKAGSSSKPVLPARPTIVTSGQTPSKPPMKASTSASGGLSQSPMTPKRAMRPLPPLPDSPAKSATANSPTAPKVAPMAIIEAKPSTSIESPGQSPPASFVTATSSTPSSTASHSTASYTSQTPPASTPELSPTRPRLQISPTFGPVVGASEPSEELLDALEPDELDDDRETIAASSVAALSIITEHTEPGSDLNDSSEAVCNTPRATGASSPVPWWNEVTSSPIDVMRPLPASLPSSYVPDDLPDDPTLPNSNADTIQPATAAVNEAIGQAQPFGDGVRFGYPTEELRGVTPFPELITLSRTGDDDDDQAAYAFEASTWSALLRFFMWYVERLPARESANEVDTGMARRASKLEVKMSMVTSLNPHAVVTSRSPSLSRARPFPKKPAALDF